MQAIRNHDRLLTDIVERLVKWYEPERIILFGSLAHGTPDDDSDIDLLIVKDSDERPLDRRVRVRRIAAGLHPRVPFSPLVLTPGELSARLSAGDKFYRQIIRDGITLYERC